MPAFLRSLLRLAAPQLGNARWPKSQRSVSVVFVIAAIAVVLNTVPARATESENRRCGTGSTIIGHDAAGFNAYCPGGDAEATAGESSNSTDPATSVSSPSAENGAHNGGSSRPPPVCSWLPVQPDESHAVPSFPGADLASGRIEKKVCGAPAEDETGLGSAVVDWRFVANVGGDRLPPPDPAVLAQQAYEELRVPAPLVHVGPDRDEVFVQIPAWLWVDDPGILSATVSAGGVTVTAIASLTSTTWTLGEPGRNPAFTGYKPGPAVTVTCQGAGVPPSPDVDWKVEPECGHTFRWRSLPERTGGTGKWPITATTTWNVTWQSNTGQSGATTLTASSQDAVEVGEYRILLVNGGR